MIGARLEGLNRTNLEVTLDLNSVVGILYINHGQTHKKWIIISSHKAIEVKNCQNHLLINNIKSNRMAGLVDPKYIWGQFHKALPSLQLWGSLQW